MAILMIAKNAEIGPTGRFSVFSYRLIDTETCEVFETPEEVLREWLKQNHRRLANAIIQWDHMRVTYAVNKMAGEFPVVVYTADGAFLWGNDRVAGDRVFIVQIISKSGRTFYKVCDPFGHIRLMEHSALERAEVEGRIIVVNKFNDGITGAVDKRTNSSKIVEDKVKVKAKGAPSDRKAVMVSSGIFDIKQSNRGAAIVGVKAPIVGTVKISDGVTAIGSRAFKDIEEFDEANELIFSPSVRRIEQNAFGANKFDRIHFNEGLEFIGDRALVGDYAIYKEWKGDKILLKSKTLNELVIPSTVRKIEAEAFKRLRVKRLIIKSPYLMSMEGLFWLHQMNAREIEVVGGLEMDLLRYYIAMWRGVNSEILKRKDLEQLYRRYIKQFQIFDKSNIGHIADIIDKGRGRRLLALTSGDRWRVINIFTGEVASATILEVKTALRFHGVGIANATLDAEERFNQKMESFPRVNYHLGTLPGTIHFNGAVSSQKPKETEMEQANDLECSREYLDKYFYLLQVDANEEKCKLSNLLGELKIENWDAVKQMEHENKIIIVNNYKDKYLGTIKVKQIT